ncbi:pyridoxal phosphate-dependent transferase [Staphylotrichum tortipilum]|uniref:Pyridoxal phosphate-dependent transferase n=1 Tax=Staphylotrichum tortipilum TaxID=2831512 RepID=A0AAN6RYL6_9PEZI|nr:pyridoxal phosphate-dependent transferase [Staphylotrichum longicolle]
MARSSLLVRFSGWKHEDRAPVPNGGVKQVIQDASWRRRSLASLSRKLSPRLKPTLPAPAVAQNAPHVAPLFDDVEAEPQCPYQRPVEQIRQEEYPHMNQGTYLDHSGATIYAHSTIHRTTDRLLTNLYGNPHSANHPAQLSGDTVDAVRLQTLRFLGADPAHFDLVFTANATAAIKLVADAFRDLAERTRAGSFWYGYHREAHTSLVGVRELVGPARRDHHQQQQQPREQHRCFEGDADVEAWLRGSPSGISDDDGRVSSLGLFAYPGQSNLTGRRLPLSWAGRLRAAGRGRARPDLRDTYTLLDAAALAMTSPMAAVFADPDAAPDFVCLSFYKVFGFPDLGGLVVRRESGHILALRKYFGGGTVSMVSTVGGAWHMSKALESGGGGGGAGSEEEHGGGGGAALHEGLEDGTLPFHSIMALGEAIVVHAELYGPMENVSAHTTALVRRMYLGMRALRYANGHPVCKIYEEEEDDGEGVGSSTGYGDAERQGATVAFNVFRADGGYESYATVERLANERGVYVRSGGICCPGGLYAALQYEPWQLHRARSAGHHCGPNGLSLINELPTGVVRASLGAMSTAQDVERFLAFLHEAFVARTDSAYASSNDEDHNDDHEVNEDAVETGRVVPEQLNGVVAAAVSEVVLPAPACCPSA